MGLSAGSKLGPYEIRSPLGTGGMGEVYRARDTKLDREVALKILPEAWVHDARRMAQLRREAQVLASLSHPNIAAVYGFEDSGDMHAVAMELVDGPTLAERLKQGQLPIEDTLSIASQVCEGLGYAHEHGIIHRDLKPSNIRVTADGIAKVLDFGLAKALEPDAAYTGASPSSTTTRTATQAGTVLGTAPYLAPELVRGRSADRRSDIWAFGAVLFEMLAGRRLFCGETMSDTLADVLKAEPDWSRLPSGTPPRVRELLVRCLKKNPRQRLQSIGDARIALEEALGDSSASPPFTGTSVSTPTWPRRLPWALAGALAVALGGALLLYSRPAAKAPASAVIAEITPPPDASFAIGDASSGVPALSPDGRRLAFVATGPDGRQRLWVRSLDSPAARVLNGTAGAGYPFWSPDSRSVGFFADGQLKTTSLSAVSPLTVAGGDAPSPRGASWGPDGTILFAPTRNGAIFRVPASGGMAQQVTERSRARQDFAHRWPQFLPDGRHFLFFIWSAHVKESAVWAGSIDGGEPKRVLRNDSMAIYVPPGYLLFVRQGTLMAQRFDAGTLETSGNIEPVTTDVRFSPGYFLAPFTVSDNGLMAYAPGTGLPRLRLRWFDRRGRPIAETGTMGFFETPSIAPDGNRLAVSVGDAESGPGQIWVYDLRSGKTRRITHSGFFDVAPVWSADGTALAFLSNRNGASLRLYRKPSDGRGKAVPLFADGTLQAQATAAEWTSDGRYLVYARDDAHAVFAMPLTGGRKPFPVVQNLQRDPQAAVSPDGRWIAYNGNDGQVDITSFPHGGRVWRVSTSGGAGARWRRDGREIFYLAPDGQLMAAQVLDTGTVFTVSRVQPLFRMALTDRSWDVAPDGQRFLVIDQGERQVGPGITLVVNWPALLER